MKKVLALALALSVSCVYAQNKTVFTSGGKLRPEQAIMDIRHYTVALNVDPVQKTIDGYCTIDLNTSQATKLLLFNLVDSFKVAKVLVNNKPESFEYKDNLIRINLDKELPASKVSVKVFYGGKPHVAIRPPWDDGFTWATDSLGHPWMAISAEAAGGKLYFPCKDHPSDEPNEGVDLIITVPKGMVVAGPGLLQGSENKGNKTTFHWKTNYTINNYSIVFAAGDYAVVTRKYTSVEGRVVPMQFYVLSYHKDKGPYQLQMLEDDVHQEEKYFGEYPWAKEKVGIVETPFLGMEHETMNAYGNKFKFTKMGGKDYDGLMHHEFGHEWWGNKVTARDWADYWIHEGICTFGDALYVRDMEGEDAYIKYFQRNALGFGNKIPIVVGKDIDEESAYNGDIYGKGAFFMHTLRFVLGDDVFFPALRGFVTNPLYTYDNMVTTDDLEHYFEQQSGKDLKPLFEMYIRSVNKLEVHVKAQRNNTYLVQLDNMSIPLPLEITTDAGTKKIMVDGKGVSVISSTPIIVDPNTYYIKKVILE